MRSAQSRAVEENTGEKCRRWPQGSKDWSEPSFSLLRISYRLSDRSSQFVRDRTGTDSPCLLLFPDPPFCLLFHLRSASDVCGSPSVSLTHQLKPPTRKG